MDENTNNVVETSTEEKATPSVETKVESDNQPTTEEQLQKLMLENAKLKRAVDKSSSEAADYKKKYNATLSEKEKADLEKAEAQARRDERLEELERINSIHDFTEKFMDLGYDKDLAKEAAAAQVDGDTDKLFEIQEKVMAAKLKAKEQELLKDIPRAKTGVYASMTKEQILAIPDRAEKRKAMAENWELFN